MNKIVAMQVLPGDHIDEPQVYALGEDGCVYKLWRSRYAPDSWTALPALPEPEPQPPMEAYT